MPRPAASTITNMPADAAMDMEQMLGAYGGVIGLYLILARVGQLQSLRHCGTGSNRGD